MCGINGFITHINLDREKGQCVLDEMNRMIHHRGPDENGSFLRYFDDYALGMAMQRLSIIDLSTGHQPIFSEDGKKVIVFNGEIYNYPALKNALLEKGVQFSTTSDTEVILKLYELEGVASFSKLDGMFAFSIYDETLDKVFIARDFFGEKPLYYTIQNNRFYWASELKSIMKVLPLRPQIDKNGLSLYFQLTYIPAPFTIYEGIKKLNLYHYLEVDCKTLSVSEKQISCIRYNDYSGISKKEAVEITNAKVKASIKSRSIADVTVGTFLSGGVDSSIVSYCLAENSNKRIETFSIGFDNKSFDESSKARTVAQMINSNHHEIILGEKDLEENLQDIILNFDEPFADSSAIPSYLVSKHASKYLKVALTGDGGDEIFGGYNKYYMGTLNQRITNVVPRKVHEFCKSNVDKLLHLKEDKRGLRFKMSKLLKAINYDNKFYFNIISLGFTSDELSKYFKNDAFVDSPFNYYEKIIGEKSKTLQDFQNIDRLISLEGDLLVKVDRTSMLNSIECRAPFLNRDLWNFTSQMPQSFLINGWDKKHLLKESFKEYFPKGFLDKPKQGFGVPVGDWLRISLKDELESFIEPEFIKTQNIFDFDSIAKMVKQHISREIDNTFRVWTFYCFQIWYKNHYLS